MEKENKYSPQGPPLRSTIHLAGNSGALDPDDSGLIGIPAGVKQDGNIATINSCLLIHLNAAGRNVLAYIIDKALLHGSPYIHIDKLSVQKYFADYINPRYANTTNVNRGIKNLVELSVLSEISGGIQENMYVYNKHLLSK